MLRHASVYSSSELDPAAVGLRVLVMRYWPRGVRRERIDLWLKDAAPSRELLRAYAHEEMAWEEFERRYKTEMLDERPEVLDRLRELELEHGSLTLICHERMPPAVHCHRTVLIELLAQAA